MTVLETTLDPLVRQLREQISDTDRAIVALMNRRLELVRKVQRRKADLGLPRLDPGREERMLRDLRRANRGPLSATGVEELHAELLALTRRELAH
jgi:3-deoxy-7-phosphoheptulonate synthase/chorismate mutase